MTNIELKKAEDAFKQGHTFFLTGKAGTGKSFFLKSILKETVKKCIVLAPTGMAALNVNGQTIHSFFKFPISPLLDPVLDTYQFEDEDQKYQLIKEVDCIIIDEISMVRADLLDAIDHSLKINGGNENLPFGGKQMLFIGDLMQLPPIIDKTVQEHYLKTYGSPYFFSAEVFKTFTLFSIELKHVYRQETDHHFLRFLNEIRDQSISQTMQDYINKRVGLQPDKDVYAIRLMTSNGLADQYNKRRLDELDGELWLFKPEIEGEVSPEHRKNFKKALALKIGAQVSFNKNDMQGRYFNGTIGKLTQITDEELTIELDNGIEIQTGKYKYEIVDYKYDTTKKRVTKNIIGTITQFPIQLAWAITIHKSQGQTYENAVIDMGNGAFSVGQTYVAFSRVKSYEGLYLTCKLYQSDIIKDARLLEAVKSIKSIVIVIKEIDNEKLICPSCNSELPLNSVSCMFCGIKVESGVQPTYYIQNGTNVNEKIINLDDLVYIEENGSTLEESDPVLVEYKYDELMPFGIGLIKTKLGGKFGLIDQQTGLLKLSPIYNRLRILSIKENAGDRLGIAHYVFERTYVEICIAGKFGRQKFGIQGIDLKEIIPCVYKEIIPVITTINFRDNGKMLFFLVKDEQKYGVLNEEGEEIIPLKFDRIRSINYLQFEVQIDNKQGIYNSEGINIVPVEYDLVETNQGALKVKRNGYYGLIDSKGRLIFTLEYDDFDFFGPRFIKLKQNGKFGLGDYKSGKLLEPCLYSEIVQHGFASIFSFYTSNEVFLKSYPW